MHRFALAVLAGLLAVPTLAEHASIAQEPTILWQFEAGG
jgi:hypothetical protein